VLDLICNSGWPVRFIPIFHSSDHPVVDLVRHGMWRCVTDNLDLAQQKLVGIYLHKAADPARNPSDGREKNYVPSVGKRVSGPDMPGLSDAHRVML
jgi:hypothetical protein